MYRLHCFATSGNCFKVAFLLRALRQPYETVFVDYFHGATRDPSWREGVNDMGEIPVLEHGDLRLTQSGAILTFLAERHGAFGGNDEAERLDVLRWLLFDNHKFTSYFATYRFLKAFGSTAPDPNVLSWLRARVDAAYTVVEHHLAGRDFVVGSAPTIADFSMSGYSFYPIEESGYDVRTRFPNIAAWLDRVRGIPGWAPPYDVLPGERVQPRW